MLNLQDRNIFMGEVKTCKHYRGAQGTVDHLATKCDRILPYEYTRRHNKVVRCIHLLMCNKFGIKSLENKRLLNTTNSGKPKYINKSRNRRRK